MKLKGLAALVLCATGCSNFVELPSNRELHINKSLPHYFIKKSREQGEKELSILAKKADCEEGWAFYNNHWVECGIDEKQSEFKYDDFKVPFSPKNATAYHIHPSKISNNLAVQINKSNSYIKEINKRLDNQFITTDERKSLIESLLAETTKKINDKALLLSTRVFPSELDIYGSIDANTKSHSIASENGIIEYCFKAKPKNKKEAFEFGKEYNLTAFTSLFEHLITNDKTDTDLINDVIGILNQKKWIEFSFRPYSE